MKKRLPILGATVAAVISMVAFAVPSFAHNDANGNKDWNDWHNNKSRQVTLKQTNLVPNTDPTAVGQMYVLTEDAFDQSNHKIGHDGITCTAITIQAGGSEFLCNGALHIDNKGDVQVQGLYTKGQTDISATITGGDGIFRFGHGQINIHSVSDTERTAKFDFN